MTRRVVISGIGIISPLGNSATEFFRAALSGRSAVARIQKFDTSGFDVHIGAEISLPNSIRETLNDEQRKEMPAPAQWAVLAARQAVKDAGLELSREDPFNINVITGVSLSSLPGNPNRLPTSDVIDLARVTPTDLALANPAAAATQISRDLGLQGEVANVSTACSSGATALTYAIRQITSGEVGCVITGGSDEGVTPFFLGAFTNANCLSKRNTDSKSASRPFDRSRDGSVLGDAACFFVLEERERALARSAPVYCEVSGFGRTCDAASPLKLGKSEGPGAVSIERALRMAALEPHDIDYYCAFGVSHPWLDIRETRMLKRVFSDHARRLSISSIQSMMGHAMGSAGVVQAATCALAIRHSSVPPTINYEEHDPECDLDYVPNEARQLRVRNAAMYALGSGGNNTAVVFSEC